MKTIKITGIGKTSMPANQIELILEVFSISKDYELATKSHGEKLQKLVDLFINLGFDKRSLKTENFNIYPKYKSVRTSTGDYKEEFEGYQINQSLIVEFDLDMLRLDKIIQSISKERINPRIDINFTIKEKEEFKNILLEKACIDARKKADILARCCNQNIVGISSIDYSFSTINIYSSSKYKVDTLAKTSTVASNIVPSDISDSTNVVFTFEIE